MLPTLLPDVCSVALTASCNANNHIVTSTLTVTAAGTVPLHTIITDSTSAALYIAVNAISPGTTASVEDICIC